MFERDNCPRSNSAVDVDEQQPGLARGQFEFHFSFATDPVTRHGCRHYRDYLGVGERGRSDCRQVIFLRAPMMLGFAR